VAGGVKEGERKSYWLNVDGSLVHVACRGALTEDEEEALVEVIRAARRAEAVSTPVQFEDQASELRCRLDALGLSMSEAWRRWPQWNLGQWSRMLQGKDDPTPALVTVPHLGV
jgi:hypothetical protein